MKFIEEAKQPIIEKKTRIQIEREKIEILREYKKLLDDGIITQEEFDAKKAEILKSK